MLACFRSLSENSDRSKLSGKTRANFNDFDADSGRI